MLRFSRISGTRSIDLMIRAGRPAAPVRAQSKAWRSGLRKRSSTGSMAWPRIPSTMTMTGVRYRSASSKAVAISSIASPIEAGASTGTR